MEADAVGFVDNEESLERPRLSLLEDETGATHIGGGIDDIADRRVVIPADWRKERN